MSLLSGVMTGGQKLTWKVYHMTDIIVERRFDGTGKCKTITEVKAEVRAFIDWAGGWSKRQKSAARQRVAYLTLTDITDRDFRFTV